MNQIKLFSYLVTKRLSPNDYAGLFNIANGITIDRKLEVDYIYLKTLGLVYQENGIWVVTKTGRSVVNHVDTYFIEQTNPKVAKRVDSTNLTTLAEHMHKMYPKQRADGRYLRCNITDLKAKLRQFFVKYKEFDFEIAYDATVHYISEEEEKNFTYTMDLTYFISKSGHSTLATWCQKIKDNKN